MARVGSKPWLGSYSAVVAGTVLVFGGFAALGWWLAAAGERAGWQALGTGVAAIVCFSVGLALLAIAHKRRDGLFKWRPSRSEEQTYRNEYRR